VLFEARSHLDDGRQPSMLPAEVGKPPRITNRVRAGKLALDLFGASDGVLETIAEAQCSLPYFCSGPPKQAPSKGFVKGWTLIKL
jgi:hypothetical protein